jgi:hypothetical protein
MKIASRLHILRVLGRKMKKRRRKKRKVTIKEKIKHRS